MATVTESASFTKDVPGRCHPVLFAAFSGEPRREGASMLTVRLLNAEKKPPTGTPGSSAFERGFDLRIETKPNLQAHRVAVVWTQNAWQAVNYTECNLVETQNGSEIWAASISYSSTPPITFFYALAAAGPDAIFWDNNQGWNYMI